MSNYKNSKIYKIVNDENNKFYIGSTTQPLHKRMYGHRSKNNGCVSKNLDVDLKECKIILIEEFECNTRQEMLIKEREYFDKYKKEKLNIVNYNRPIISEIEKNQYYENNKEPIEDIMKEFALFLFNK
jgi:predicted GIY-YIG superfamily endonuclease